MIPAKNRLKNKKDFEKTLRYGYFFSLDNLTLKVFPNNLNITRVGFVVSRKAEKKAVARNRKKRIMRGAVARLIKRIKPGYDIVLILRSNHPNLKERGMDKSISNILKKANLF